jgi:hypothetical protein
MTETDFEMALFLTENARLQEENASLRSEIDDLLVEAELDACHAAGLVAQIRALIAESDACPNRAAHALLERTEYTNSITGEPMTKTKAYPLYRQGFDDKARELEIDDPESLRA